MPDTDARALGDELLHAMHHGQITAVGDHPEQQHHEHRNDDREFDRRRAAMTGAKRNQE
jgi:hypothetical protein